MLWLDIKLTARPACSTIFHMIMVVPAIGAYVAYCIWFPFVLPETFFPFVLSWAGAASVMSIAAGQRNLFPLIFFSVLGLVATFLFYYQSMSWVIGIGACAGAVTPYLVQAARSDKSSGYGVALGAAAVMCLAYLKPNIPGDYLRTFVGILPLCWLLAVTALRLPPREGWRVQYRWGYAPIMLFSVGFVTGVYQDIVFYELSLVGWAYHLILFIPLSAGAFIVGRSIAEKRLKIAHALSFMLAIPLSLALFGFKASVLTYALSSAFIGFGLGGAAVFVLSLLRNYDNVQRSVCLGSVGLGLLAGSGFADLSLTVYGVDMEGIAFITTVLFLAGAVPAMTMLRTGARASDSATPETASASVSAEAPAEHLEHELSFEDFCRSFGLSKREVEVMEVLLEGKTAKEIAESMFVSESTVKTHIRHIYEKTGVKNKMELLRMVQGKQ